MFRLSVFLAMPLLAACVVVPTGPSQVALPGSTKTFEQFRYDDAVCRQYALEQSGSVTAAQAGEQSIARSAALGTVIGAAAGAAMGGSQGAGVGAGTGLLFGSMAGTGTAQASSYGVQQRYDNAYVQCMYAKGHRVPVSGYYGPARYVAPTTAPASPRSIPPPPPGFPPPPPPGVVR